MSSKTPAARAPRGPARRATRPKMQGYSLRVNAFDRSSGLLVALLLIVGMITLGLVVLYFSGKIKRLPPAIPVTPVNAPGDSGAPAPGDAQDQAAGVPDAPEPDTPTLQSTLDVLSAVADSQTAFYNDQAIDDAPKPARGKGGKGDNRGVGQGSGAGGKGAREPMRELRFEPASEEDYARWLDKAGIELGVLGGDNRVHYASNFASGSIAVRDGAPRDERRLYFNSSGGPLDSLDRALAERSGIGEFGPIVLQFCSEELQARLLALERERAGGRPTSKIVRTVFRVTQRGEEFDIKVESQEFRP